MKTAMLFIETSNRSGVTLADSMDSDTIPEVHISLEKVDVTEDTIDSVTALVTKNHETDVSFRWVPDLDIQKSCTRNMWSGACKTVCMECTAINPADAKRMFAHRCREGAPHVDISVPGGSQKELNDIAWNAFVDESRLKYAGKYEKLEQEMAYHDGMRQAFALAKQLIDERAKRVSES